MTKKDTNIGNGSTKELSKYKHEIETINEKILSLLTARREIAEAIGKAKKDAGLDIVDPGEEEAVLRRLTRANGHELPKEAIRSIFKEILSVDRAVQAPLTVAYLGPEASFSHQSALSIFGQSAEYRPAESIEEVFDLVEKDRCLQGVVPIENAFEGSLTNTLDLLRDYGLRITAENLLRVRYHLLASGRDVERFKVLYAHPMAAAQCRAWIRNRMPGVSIEESTSSSMAARQAAEDPEAAALGNQLAAKTYNLTVLEEGIEDHPDNVTRYVSIGRTEGRRTGKDKTSIMFSANHRPGALFEILKTLAKRDVNMTRIESRPMKTRSWEYLFFVDLQGHEEDKNIRSALKKLEAHCESFKRLGSYPVGKSPWP